MIYSCLCVQFATGDKILGLSRGCVVCVWVYVWLFSSSINTMIRRSPACSRKKIIVYASFIHHQDTNAPHAGIFVKAIAKFLKNKFWIFLSYHGSSVSVFTGAFTLRESFTGSCFVHGNSTLVLYISLVCCYDNVSQSNSSTQ